MNETTRDRIWKYALASTIRSGDRVTPSDIAEMADVAERTARETLVVIAETGWISRETRQDGSVFYEGSDLVDFDNEEWEAELS
jgi:DNA-binding GntR family transcriptional regulator